MRLDIPILGLIGGISFAGLMACAFIREMNEADVSRPTQVQYSQPSTSLVSRAESNLSTNKSLAVSNAVSNAVPVDVAKSGVNSSGKSLTPLTGLIRGSSPHFVPVYNDDKSLSSLPITIIDFLGDDGRGYHLVYLTTRLFGKGRVNLECNIYSNGVVSVRDLLRGSVFYRKNTPGASVEVDGFVPQGKVRYVKEEIGK